MGQQRRDQVLQKQLLNSFEAKCQQRLGPSGGMQQRKNYHKVIKTVFCFCFEKTATHGFSVL